MPSNEFLGEVEPGWPTTLPRSPDPGATFLNAFKTGAEINRRKQQLENQMAAMALKSQQENISNSIREGNLQRELDQGNQRLEIARGALGLRDTMDQLKMFTIGQKMDDAEKVITQTQGFEQYMLESGVSINDKAYPATLRMAKILNPYAKVDTEKHIDTFNARRGDREKKSVEDEKLVLTQAAMEDFGGNKVDAGLFTNPQNRVYPVFETEQSDQERQMGRASIPAPAPGAGSKRRDAATGGWYNVILKKDPKTHTPIQVPDTMAVQFPAGSDQVPVFINITKQRMKERQDQLQKVYQERATIPPAADVDTTPSNAIRIYSRKQYKALPGGQAFIWHNPATGKDETWHAPPSEP
jgi:hypothetical protein